MTHPLPAGGATTAPSDDDPQGADAHIPCPACGAHNDEAAHFCVVCGAALATTIVIPDDGQAG